MFANSPNPQAVGSQIASKLADHASFKSHSRFIDRHWAKSVGLVVDDLEADQALQDAVLSVFHATSHTFNASGVVKIIENHQGKEFMKAAGQVVIQQQPPRIVPPIPPQVPPT